MSSFVEECRVVWRRLGVPDPVANEMAADLTADLEEAEAEGGSLEDVLGNSAFDASGFATAWAQERGVASASEPAGPVGPEGVTGAGRWARSAGPGRRRPPMAVVLTGLFGILALGLGLAVLAGDRRASFAMVAQRVAAGPLPFRAGGPGNIIAAPGNIRVFGPGPGFFMHAGGVGFGPAPLAVGLILLVVGLVGVGLALWYWAPWSGRRLRRG